MHKELAGYNPWGGFKELDSTERLALSFQIGQEHWDRSSPRPLPARFLQEALSHGRDPLRKPRCQCTDFPLQLHPESAQHSEGWAFWCLFVG